jgi:Fe-S-cluster containining protein
MTRTPLRDDLWYEPLRALHERVKEHIGCRACGSCCFLAPIMTYQEALVIEAYLTSHPVDYEPMRYMCDFLRPDTKRCHIYEVRPMICRLWGHGGTCSKVQGMTREQVEQEAARFWHGLGML